MAADVPPVPCAPADVELAALRAAVEAAPASAAARAALAAGLLREGVAAAAAKDRPRARGLLRELTSLAPEDDRAWMWLASVAEGYREARACLTQVLERSPEHPQAREALDRLEARAAAHRRAAPAPAQPAVALDAGAPATPRGVEPPLPAVAASATVPAAAAAPVPVPIAAAPAPTPAGPPTPAVAPASERPARPRTLGFSPTSTLFRTEADAEPVDTARPGSVLHLFDDETAADRATEAPAAEPRARAGTAHPIGFRPPFAGPAASPGHDRPLAAPARPAVERLPSRGVVLVVDDSPTVLKGLEFELKGQRVDVLTASSGPEALQRLLSVTPDLVLLDADMPLMDGYQVCRAIRGEDRTRLVPVVMLVTGGGIAERVRCRMAGAAGLLQKPLDAAALTEALDRHLPVRF